MPFITNIMNNNNNNNTNENIPKDNNNIDNIQKDLDNLYNIKRFASLQCFKTTNKKYSSNEFIPTFSFYQWLQYMFFSFFADYINKIKLNKIIIYLLLKFNNL